MHISNNDKQTGYGPIADELDPEEELLLDEDDEYDELLDLLEELEIDELDSEDEEDEE
jgi:hypothetical protein